MESRGGSRPRRSPPGRAASKTPFAHGVIKGSSTTTGPPPVEAEISLLLAEAENSLLLLILLEARRELRQRRAAADFSSTHFSPGSQPPRPSSQGKDGACLAATVNVRTHVPNIIFGVLSLQSLRRVASDCQVGSFAGARHAADRARTPSKSGRGERDAARAAIGSPIAGRPGHVPEPPCCRAEPTRLPRAVRQRLGPVSRS